MENLTNLNYKELQVIDSIYSAMTNQLCFLLQARAKLAGIPANKKKEVLLALLIERQSSIAAESAPIYQLQDIESDINAINQPLCKSSGFLVDVIVDDEEVVVMNEDPIFTKEDEISVVIVNDKPQLETLAQEQCIDLTRPSRFSEDTLIVESCNSAAASCKACALS
jgi:hypothetical protein